MLTPPSASSVSFFEVLGKFGCAVVPAKFLCPLDQRAVARHLVMLDGLRRSDEGGIEDTLVIDFASNLVSFLQNAVDRRAVDGLGLYAMHLEDLLQTFDLPFGFDKMTLEAGLQCRVRRLLDHLRQVLNDLLFGVVDVAERVDEQVVHRLDVLGKKSHRIVPFMLFFSGAAAARAVCLLNAVNGGRFRLG
jgi:hypothetical protein